MMAETWVCKDFVVISHAAFVCLFQNVSQAPLLSKHLQKRTASMPGLLHFIEACLHR